MSARSAGSIDAAVGLRLLSSDRGWPSSLPRRALGILKARRVASLEELSVRLSCPPDVVEAALGRRRVARVVERLAPVRGGGPAADPELAWVFYRVRERDDGDDLWQSHACHETALSASAARRLRNWRNAGPGRAGGDQAPAQPGPDSLWRHVRSALRGIRT